MNCKSGPVHSTQFKISRPALQVQFPPSLFSKTLDVELELANVLVVMASRATFTHNFKHLRNEKPFVAQKPARRFPQGPPQKVKGVAHPRDRVKFWNVQAGDKIGIFRGNYKPDGKVGEEGGRDTVFEVHDVDKKRNWVEIKDLSVCAVFFPALGLGV